MGYSKDHSKYAKLMGEMAKAERLLTEAERLATEQTRLATEAEKEATEAERIATQSERNLTAQERQNTANERLVIRNQQEAFEDSVQANYDTFTRDISRTVEDENVIYGVFWDKSSNPALVRTNGSIGKVANVGIGSQRVQNDFDNAQIFREIGPVTDSLGNEFIRIPKFYIKKTNGAGFLSKQISKKQYPGYYLPKIFWDFTNNKELPYADIGRYRATLGAGNKLESKPGLFPLISRTIVNFRDYARANNASGLLGYQQMDIHAYDVLTTLFHIEFATLNSQAVMSGFSSGNYSSSHVALLTEALVNRVVLTNAQADTYRVGQSIGIGTTLGANNITDYRLITAINVVDAANKAIVFDGAPVNITAGNVIYNTGCKTGFSRDIAASSGSPVSNTDGKWPCSYRGIESPWGDIWTFIDGVNINEGQAWVAPDATTYSSNLFAAPYEQLGYVTSLVEGYPKAMGWDQLRPYAEFPVEVGGNSATYYSDYYYRAAGQRVAVVGGSWHSGSSAGLAYWYLTYSSGYAVLNIGGRLLKKAL